MNPWRCCRHYIFKNFDFWVANMILLVIQTKLQGRGGRGGRWHGPRSYISQKHLRDTREDTNDPICLFVMGTLFWTLKPQGYIREGTYDQIFRFGVFSFFLNKSFGKKKIYNLHPVYNFFMEKPIHTIDPNFNIL